ncbi:MAG: hypothetical protein KJ025_08420 [Burkholderiales bacterium]|nr:hypothetical protein [Burkholderiales bacterium]
MAEAQAFATLTYGVRLPVVAKYLGQLAVALAGVALVPALVAAALAEPDVASRFALVTLVLAGAGFSLARRPAPRSVQTNEALVVTALAYLLGAAAMAFPLAAAGLAPGTALFESISGLTTTGLTLIANVDALPRSVLFARAWLQWCGGLGIVVLSVVLLAESDVASRRLIEPAPVGEHLATTAAAFARRMLAAYIALTAAVLAVLLAVGVGAFDALAYSLAGVSTGGFAPHQDGLAAYGGGARVAVIATGLAGAVALPLYAAAARGDWRRVASDVELRALALLATGVCVALALLGAGGDLPLLDRVLLGVSAQTTTGFASAPAAALDAASKVVLLAAMCIGGAVGSTAGGIKLLRLVLAAKAARLMLRRMAMPPRAVAELHLQGRRIEDREALRALVLVLTFILFAVASWLPFVIAGYDPLDSLFEVVSALGTVGLSTGITAESLPAGLKAVLAADMLLGRVEFLAMLVLLQPATWFARRVAER